MRAFLCIMSFAAAQVSVMSLFAQSALADRYELIDRAGRVTATAEALPGRLIVYESTGERVYFSREPRYDSVDRKLLGFYNTRLNRILRFPRSGFGAMQLADLDDAVPRFRTTQRTVRPMNSRAPGVPVPIPTRPRVDRGLSGGYGPVPMPGYASGYSPYVGTGPAFGPAFGSPYYAPPRPQSVLIDSQSFRNPPLKPVSLELTNGGPKELRVTVVDLKEPAGTREIRIQPRQTVVIIVQRDSGGRLVQTFRTITSLGEAITKEVVTPIAPEVRYEVVAHEWAMQSIAIDRTGKSPNVIEDVNFQGRGLGRFPLPPGDRLQPGRIDVYSAAKRAGNQGTVAPITAAEKQLPANSDPLERAIFEAQKRAQN